jgi:hypothetical protein
MEPYQERLDQVPKPDRLSYEQWPADAPTGCDFCVSLSAHAAFHPDLTRRAASLLKLVWVVSACTNA